MGISELFFPGGWDEGIPSEIFIKTQSLITGFFMSNYSIHYTAFHPPVHIVRDESIVSRAEIRLMAIYSTISKNKTNFPIERDPHIRP